MARLIIKSPYFKGGGSSAKNAVGYLRYIATRERVELLPDDRPPTHKQEQLIKKLTKDFPESKMSAQYLEYTEEPTKYHASEFISSALENHWTEVSRSEVYMKYIATRPRAEQLGRHGLFGDEDIVDLEKAMTELSEYSGNVWTHIISLKREDAERLGYDNAKAWRNPSVLLCTVRLLHHTSNIFWETLPSPNPAGGHVESKLMRRIREKKIAMGHKPDDHEDYQGPSMSM